MARKQQMLSDSSKTIGGAALLVVLLIVSAVLSSVYSNEESSGPVHSVQAGVSMVAAPLQFVGVGVAYAEDAAGDAIQNATASDSSYTQLRDENAQLKAQLAELQEYRGEAQRLQGLLDLSDKYDFSGVTGRVIGKGTDAWNRVVTLNVGSASGVECGLPVVGGSGLVGQVIEVSPLTCRVRPPIGRFGRVAVESCRRRGARLHRGPSVFGRPRYLDRSQCGRCRYHVGSGRFVFPRRCAWHGRERHQCGGNVGSNYCGGTVQLRRSAGGTYGRSSHGVRRRPFGHERCFVFR